jgi:hypothetical protein
MFPPGSNDIRLDYGHLRPPGLFPSAEEFLQA